MDVYLRRTSASRICRLFRYTRLRGWTRIDYRSGPCVTWPTSPGAREPSPQPAARLTPSVHRAMVARLWPQLANMFRRSSLDRVSSSSSSAIIKYAVRIHLGVARGGAAEGWCDVRARFTTDEICERALGIVDRDGVARHPTIHALRLSPQAANDPAPQRTSSWSRDLPGRIDRDRARGGARS
jgi:hypothetical protein